MLLGSLPGLADADLRDGLPDRQQQDPDVEPERLVLHVPDVELEAPLPRERVAAVELRPPGDPGAHVVAAGLLPGIARQILHQQRPRADQAHVAPDHVDETRLLVDAPSAAGARPTGWSLPH